jgi:FMN phosphatase YigB (HAD superfamily)
MKEEQQGRPYVILDIDGVVNSFSNKLFYASFAYHAMHELAKLKSRKELIKGFSKLKKMGGSNALFRFAKEFCGDEATFQKYRHNLFLRLNFNLVKSDPSLREFIKRLGSYSDVIIRTDGLGEVAYGVWQRIMKDETSAKIKVDLLDSQASLSKKIPFMNTTLQISDIVENGLRTKAEGKESWLDFADRYKINLSESVLIDDSQNNCHVAKELGMTVVKISRLDSFLESSPFKDMMHKSLPDVLGIRMSHALNKLSINYGEKVDVKTLFQTLLKTPVSEILRNKSQKRSKG